MSESILLSTKKILGLSEDYTAFDFDIITHINTALMIVSQLGIGPEDGVMIQDESTTWEEVIQSDNMRNSVKTYVYLRVRLLFDPPTSSFLVKALEDQLREIEWRLNVHRESYSWTSPSLTLPV